MRQHIIIRYANVLLLLAPIGWFLIAASHITTGDYAAVQAMAIMCIAQAVLSWHVNNNA